MTGWRESSFVLQAALVAAFYPSTAVLLGGPALQTPRALLLSLLLGAMLAALSLIDLRTYRLPDVLTLTLAVAGCLSPDPLLVAEIAWRMAAAVAGWLAFFAIATFYRRWRGFEGLGLGDAKLLGAGGAWLGMEALPLVVLVASSLALAVAGLLVASGRQIDGKSRLPFGPFLAAGIWLAWLELHSII